MKMTVEHSSRKRAEALERLDLELQRLKRLLNFGHELSVRWLPGSARCSAGRRLSGEVRGNVITIYDEREADALATLKHEFLEYALVEQLVAPYKRMLNALISLIEEDAYIRRERAVKRLVEVLFKRDLENPQRANENGQNE
jgi:hypothetical protein